MKKGKRKTGKCEEIRRKRLTIKVKLKLEG
jgi:hypothetical protein